MERLLELDAADTAINERVSTFYVAASCILVYLRQHSKNHYLKKKVALAV